MNRRRKYLEGSTVRVQAFFRVPGILLIEPTTVTLSITSPSGMSAYTYGVDPELKTDAGLYYCDLLASEVGDWSYTFTASGNMQAASRGAFIVRA